VFPGDAELASWSAMARAGVLRPVHLLKVSHHGSHNGTPPDELLDQILPLRRQGGRRRYALVSTWPDTYGGVPDEHTMDRLAARVDEVVSTRDVSSGTSVTIDFEG
jgi:beta-lactamase superfamily II metal-dependent hydrolase